jgi:hypothetical protein
MKRTRLSRVSPRQRAFLGAYAPLRAEILERDGHRCRYCHRDAQRSGAPLEAHHVIKRSTTPRLKLDPDNLLTLCRDCHARTDFPYADGRLIIFAEGDGMFRFGLEYRDSKFAARGTHGAAS